MQQTIQFDPERDPVSTVLLQVARAYGFSGITEAMASNGKPLGIYPPREPRQPQIAWQPLHEIAWGTPGGEPVEEERKDVPEEGSVWTVKRTAEFLHNLTPPARQGIALLTVQTSVSSEEMAEYIGVETLQGVFSTVGSAVRNTEGLPDEVRPYIRYRSPKKVYKMEPAMQKIFHVAYSRSPRLKHFLDRAVEYKTKTAVRRLG